MKNVWALGWVQSGEHRERERESEHVWLLLDLIWTFYIDVDGWRHDLISDEIFAGPQKLCILMLDFQGLREYWEDHHWRLDALETGWTCEVATALCCLHGFPAEGLAGLADWRLAVPGSSCTDWWWLVMKNKLASIFFGRAYIYMIPCWILWENFPDSSKF